MLITYSKAQPLGATLITLFAVVSLYSSAVAAPHATAEE